MNSPVSPQEIASHDGRHKLVIHAAPNPAGEQYFGHLRIQVLETSDGAVVGETTRNYGNPSVLHFVSQDGVDYLVLSEDYHGGYGVMNLLTGEKAVYTPEQDPALAGEEHWCWAAGVSHDPIARRLTISGCYWACPYERSTFDFSQPMSPPYPLLERVLDPEEAEDAPPVPPAGDSKPA